MRRTTLWAGLFCLFLSANLWAAEAAKPKHNPNQQEKARRALERAHKKFLEKKYKGMVLQLKKALTLGHRSQEIRKNALDLLSLAQQERGTKRMPVDWKLPKEMKYFKVGFRRMHNKMTHYTAFKLDVIGLMENTDDLEQVKIVKYPNRLIVDKERGVGDFDTWTHDDGNGFYIGRRFSEIDFDGLYHFKIKIKGQDKPMRGWFIAESMNISATPIILAPKDGDTVNTNQPEFRWEEFFSPEYQGYEHRRLNLKVTNFDLLRKKVWRHDRATPDTVQARIGQDGEGVSQLDPGSYLLHVHYGERRKFGGITLSRDGRTVVGFEVKE